LVNIVLKPNVYETHRKVLRSPFAVVEGKLQRRGQAISVLARKVVAVKVKIDASTAPSTKAGAQTSRAVNPHHPTQ
jgi:hypothetical protein